MKKLNEQEISILRCAVRAMDPTWSPVAPSQWPGEVKAYVATAVGRHTLVKLL